MTVFVDSSAWYALLDADDDYHARARRTLEQLGVEAPLVTHNYVVVETLAVTERRLGRAQSVRFATDLLPVADIEWIQPSLHEVALTTFRGSDGRASFVDHVSFALMRGRGMTRVFAFDDDFATQGFDLIGA